jgi:hypothetical protein
VGDTVKTLFGGRSKAEKQAMRAQQMAAEAQQRAANQAGEDLAAKAGDVGLAARRAQMAGRKQLTWMPLGGARAPLGSGTGRVAP